jgi:dTDP-4-amino-4,6-dideoxygalactose transaminase
MHKLNVKQLNVTMPSLAPLEDYVELLKGVWDRGILTHNGPLVKKLEYEIESKLALDHFLLVSNGTIALQMAIRALELKGEIITTPFTWVATISAIKWEGCTPIFADIDPATLNIDPAKIEAAITERTVAIMPVHVFGNPCDVDAIEGIAKKYGLKVIYDAAHAVGSTLRGQSILRYGDISITSLHATKLLNTAEGGGCITSDRFLAKKLERIRFFGHDDEKEIVEDGFNGKMTEIHAALGLANLTYYDQVITDRKQKYIIYKEELNGTSGLCFQELRQGESNFSYFPVIFSSEEQLHIIERALNLKNIFPRRYFHPSVNTLKNIVDYTPCEVSENISKCILCLPLHYNMTVDDILSVCKILRNEL